MKYLSRNKLLLVIVVLVGIAIVFFTTKKDVVEDHSSKFNITEEWFTQNVSPAVIQGETFNQQVFTLTPINADMHSPVFFVLGNEGNATQKGLISIYKAYGSPGDVIFMTAEHRGYGQSITVGDQSVPSYVTANNALIDFNHVIVEKQKHYKGKWIIAGYSYGGALSIAYSHKYPETVDVTLSSSGPIEWPLFFKGYAAKINEDLEPEFIRRLKDHGDNLIAMGHDDQTEERKELLSVVLVGMSQMGDQQSLIALISALSYLSTDFFFDILAMVLPEPAFHWSKAQIATSAPADIDTRSWYVWKYQQCNELGTFFTEKPFANTEQDHLKRCADSFGSPASYAQQQPWQLGNMINQLTKPIVIVAGGKDPWINVGVKPDHNYNNIDYIYSAEWLHCPDRSNSDASSQVFASLMNHVNKS